MRDFAEVRADGVIRDVAKAALEAAGSAAPRPRLV